MKVSIKDVEHVAWLARLGLTEEEKQIFTEQLSRILEYADRINQLKTEGVEPTTHAIPMKNIFRQDEVRPFKETDLILGNAPVEENRLFKVPKIIE